MTEREQSKAFAEELDRLCDRFAEEFDITYTSIVGGLEFKKAELIKQALENEEDDL